VATPYWYRFNMRVDPNSQLEIWQPQLNFLALIASWGAIWSTLALVFGSLGWLYNRTKYRYYIRNDIDGFRSKKSNDQPESLPVLENILKLKTKDKEEGDQARLVAFGTRIVTATSDSTFTITPTPCFNESSL